ALSMLVTGLAGGAAWWYGRGADPRELLRKEALAVVGLGWFFAAVFGSLPLHWGETDLSAVESLFESTSGFTTTGATVIEDLDQISAPLLLWRSLSQWIGGLGILALIVSLLSSVGASSRSLFSGESSLNLAHSPLGRVKDLTLHLWRLYFALTLTAWIFLWITGLCLPDVQLSLFHALLYALTAVATGGFAPHDASVGHFDSVAIEVVMCLFMILSSLNMVFLLNLAFRQFDKRAGQTEAIAFLVLIAAGICLVWLDFSIRGIATPEGIFREVFFPILSTATTTGFTHQDYDQWPLFSKVILIALILVGGCSGSTSGGLKVIRVFLTLRFLRQEITRTFRPQRVFVTRIDGNAIGKSTQSDIFSFLAFVCLILLSSTLFLTLIDPAATDLTTAGSTVLSSFFNIGPAFGNVGPTKNFASYHEGSLLFLSFLMLLGRLEIFAVVALFSRHLWSRY
ncbi:MAG: potassium transporter TrkG, partial [Verrucomicrobiota bacterium]